MDKKEIKNINLWIALIVLIMIGIPCIYYLVNRICFVCTIENISQDISKKFEEENRQKLEKSYEEDYIVNAEGTYKKSDIKKDEILEKQNIQEFDEKIYDSYEDVTKSLLMIPSPIHFNKSSLPKFS